MKAYRCHTCGEEYINHEKPKSCPFCGTDYLNYPFSVIEVDITNLGLTDLQGKENLSLFETVDEASQQKISELLSKESMEVSKRAGFDPIKTKEESKEKILSITGDRYSKLAWDWLPWSEFRKSRPKEEIIARISIMSAFYPLLLGYPISKTRAWINNDNLSSYLSPSEKEFLDKEDRELTEQEKFNIDWSIQAVCALLWIGGLVDDLPINKEGDPKVFMQKIPNFNKGETSVKLKETMIMRSDIEINKMEDLYYHCHWIAKGVQLHPIEGSNQIDNILSVDHIMERRKALTWVLSPLSNWDNVELST